MTYPITLGLIIGARELHQEVQACLKDAGPRVILEQSEIGDWSSLLEKIDRLRPDVLLIDFTQLKESHEAVIAQIKGTTAAPQVIALHTSADPETILSVIRAGADEYLYPPLAANLEKALERLAAGRNKLQPSAPNAGGRTCGFFSAKGGCGATTIACHIAVEIARQANQEVLLADFDLDAGLVGFLMKSKSRYSILDAMSNTHRLDANYWRALISNGMPRLQVIRAPGAMVQREEFKLEDVQAVLRFMRFQYGWTIVDMGRGLNPLVLNTLGELDEAYLVTTLDVPALHQVKQIIRNLLDSGFGQSRLRLVLNRVSKAPDVMPHELEGLLGIPLHSMLPDDYVSLYEAYAEGQLLASNSNLGKQFSRMAAKIAGISEPTGKKKFSIFGG